MPTILLVDDSAFTRKVLRTMISSFPDFSVIAEASNGIEGMKLIDNHTPDIVILDVEMPLMNGLTLLKEIKKRPHRPRILLFSAHTQQHAQITMECLLEGGSDYLYKPTDLESLSSLSDLLFQKLTNLSTLTHNTTHHSSLPPKLICIAASTGGPDMLKALFQELHPEFSIPIAIVQHMPPNFTHLLAQTLSKQTNHLIQEANEKGALPPNTIILAKGGTHLNIIKSEHQIEYQSTHSPPIHGLRPSADILFSSAAHALPARVLGIVLTGMGHDGTTGAIDIHQQGGKIIVQDEESSTVWGMPGSVVRSGIPTTIQTIPEIATHLNMMLGLVHR